jgi:hypothetical protein
MRKISSMFDNYSQAVVINFILITYLNYIKAVCPHFLVDLQLLLLFALIMESFETMATVMQSNPTMGFEKTVPEVRR